MDESEPPLNDAIMPLVAETVTIGKRVRRTRVCVVRTTRKRQEMLSADLIHENVEVERVAVGRVVETMPPVRVEDGVTIMPIVEEEIVITRRLILKEELHIRQVRGVTRHAATVDLLRQEAAVDRVTLDEEHEQSSES